MPDSNIASKSEYQSIINEMFINLKESILENWYPLVIDETEGGYFSNVSYDWKIEPQQDKMVVSQARHIWTTSKAAAFLDDPVYIDYAEHGYNFLKEEMWDKEFGGLFQIRSRSGKYSEYNGWRDEKRTYGNAFGIYGLASLFNLTGNEEVLEFAKEIYYWIEEHSYDPEYKGYFQFITNDGKPFGKDDAYKSIAGDNNEVGYKDQNSSIHLLEAYTELYNVWKDPQLKEKLHSILCLIRDKMTTEKGYLNLFFNNNWTPVSFKNAPEDVRKANYGLDHVSFGHDYETAFLMLEASHMLGIENDTTTLKVAKKMMDHALENGFDRNVGGFYDAGYYFNDSDKCTIIKDTKNWWAQAEGLNSLLIFSNLFPDEKKYRYAFLNQWQYIKKYILDNENGDWFEGGIDKEPHFKTGPKSQIWKCTYHTSRALMNCIKMLANEGFELSNNDRFRNLKNEFDEFISHWKHVAEKLQLPRYGS